MILQRWTLTMMHPQFGQKLKIHFIILHTNMLVTVVQLFPPAGHEDENKNALKKPQNITTLCWVEEIFSLSFRMLNCDILYQLVDNNDMRWLMLFFCTKSFLPNNKMAVQTTYIITIHLCWTLRTQHTHSTVSAARYIWFVPWSGRHQSDRPLMIVNTYGSNFYYLKSK